MFKNLPSFVRYSFIALFVLFFLFIVFSISVRFFEFPFSVDSVKQQFSTSSMDQPSSPTDTSPDVSADVSGDSPWAAIKNQGLSEYQESIRYFEGPKFYEEVGGVKRLLLIEGIVDSIDFERQVISIKHLNSDEIAEVSYGSTDLYYIIGQDQDGSISETEISISEVGIGDRVSYNPADLYYERTFPIWVISR